MLRSWLAVAFALSVLGCHKGEFHSSSDGSGDGPWDDPGYEDPYDGLEKDGGRDGAKDSGEDRDDGGDYAGEYGYAEGFRTECGVKDDMEGDSRFVVTVLDENDAPLVDATLFVRLGRQKIETRNPESNVFTVFAPSADEYEITVYRDGYRAETKMLVFDGDEAVDLAFPMKLSPWRQWDEPEHGREPDEACSLPILEGATAHFIAGYEGDSKHRYRYHPQADVMVNVDGGVGPIVLVLSSHEPIRWHVSHRDGARPVHVILNGQYRQEVELPDGSPVPTTHCKLGAPYEGRELRSFVAEIAGRTGAKVGSVRSFYRLPKWIHLRQ